MSNATELARHEERAQHGIIEFAEEMQAIRDDKLYPNAESDSQTVKAAWKAYCQERWSMGKGIVDDTIRALPVLQRLANGGAARQTPTITSAAAVATLPEKVQDAILDTTEKRDDVKAKAKAVRKEAERIRVQEAREPEDDELVQVAATVTPATKKKPKMKDSKFISLLSQGFTFVEDAADYAQSNILSDTENDWGWDRVEKLRHQADRIAERLYRPEHARDWNEEAAALLSGDES